MRSQSVSGGCIHWLVRDAQGNVVRYDGKVVNVATRDQNNNWHDDGAVADVGEEEETEGETNDDEAEEEKCNLKNA